MMPESKQSSEVVTLAGGCFWCLQPVFQELRGVEKVEVGYSGGRLANPSYEAVCTDTTGHAEAVQVTFDPSVIPLADILRIFFSVHDPTTLNRQGGDVGTQYRSAVFYASPEQEKTTRQVIAEIHQAGIWDRPIVTEVTPLQPFYRAEEYHQDYFRKNPTAGYNGRSEEHTSELQSLTNLVCRLLLEKKKTRMTSIWQARACAGRGRN